MPHRCRLSRSFVGLSRSISLIASNVRRSSIGAPSPNDSASTHDKAPRPARTVETLQKRGKLAAWHLDSGMERPRGEHCRFHQERTKPNRTRLSSALNSHARHQSVGSKRPKFAPSSATQEDVLVDVVAPEGIHVSSTAICSAYHSIELVYSMCSSLKSKLRVEYVAFLWPSTNTTAGK